MILAPKFLESLLFHLMHSLTHVCCILLIDYVCFVLGNVVPKPFNEDFQDQAFDESLLFFKN
jgi:hypothetical protein